LPKNSQSSASFRSLEQQVEQAMQTDRHRLRRMLRSIRQAEQTGKPFDRNLARLNDQLQCSLDLRQAREANRPAIRFEDDLPILAAKDQIARAIDEHQVVVVCGETGSGKSTQLPKICLELGRGITGTIGHTQPRRIAARSVAARIAQELNVAPGSGVGFKIRFTDVTSPQTYIKLMTDGILLAESQHDRFLDQYDTIIIDEAHERSLNIDFLLGYVKRLLPRRRDLKLIITSATIDAARFSEHFASAAGPAPVIEVSGRTYPVELRYRPITGENDAKEADDADEQRGLVNAVDELARIDNGDMLIFMPTEWDIRETAKILRGRPLPGDQPGRTTEILPLYGRLSTAEQNRVFQPHSHRRIVIATNVAESSLTVPGIRYVIDPGTARISRYSARSKVQRLPIEAVSQASADQRKGRCGRVGPGICIRLYSQQDFETRDRYTTPEIQRTNLASVILQTKALGLGEIEEFPFLDPPKPAAVADGYKTLFELGALDERQQLTPLGKKLSRMPVDPRIGRMILAAHDENCLHEVLIIASALEVQDPRERPIDKQQAADECHAQFADPESDFLSYLKLWDFYHHLKGTLSQNQLRKACRQNFLSYNRLREWADVYRQLLQNVEQAGLKQRARRAGGVNPPINATKSKNATDADITPDQYAAIHRALLTGLLSNIAYRPDGFEYTGAGGGKFHLWPGSATFSKKPKWIVAAELVETSRRYLRTVARINPNWIEPLAQHLVNRSYSEPHWDAAGASAVAYEKVSLFGLTIVPRRTVRYGPIDPAKSRELLIQHGLVEGDIELKGKVEFLDHNRRLLEELEALQAKSRQHDFLLGEEARYDFYDRRLPADAYDGPRLQKWRKTAERDNPRVLFMEKSDLLQEKAGDIDAGDFPDILPINQMRLPLEYHLEPGTDQDGITLTVPKEGLNQVDPHRLGWLVPGLLEQKIVAMIKSLPKAIRRAFVPAPETAKLVLQQIRFGEGDFNQAVARALSKIAGEPIPVEEFQLDRLPSHLRMNVRVIDGGGQALASGRDIEAIRRQMGAEASASFSALDTGAWNRDGITAWDFGDLPPHVNIERGGLTLKGYPALIDKGNSVSLRLLDSAQQALRETRAGQRRLFLISEKRHLKSQVDWLPKLDRLTLQAAAINGFDLKRQTAELIADRALFAGGVISRTEAEFAANSKLGKQRISIAVQDVTALVVPIVEGQFEVRQALNKAKAPLLQFAVADLREQLKNLLGPTFLTSTPWDCLRQFPRYFRAMLFRLDKLAASPARDRQHQEDVHRRWHAYVQRAADHGQQGIHDAQLEYYRWLLEEYRVSLFAQKLGTAVPISPKRLDEQWAKARPGK
jgi:ATP-dependent helicase HrpA